MHVLPIKFVAVGSDDLGQLRRIGYSCLIGGHSNHVMTDLDGSIRNRFDISASDINLGTLSKPMPELAPVTTKTLFAKDIGFSLRLKDRLD